MFIIPYLFSMIYLAIIIAVIVIFYKMLIAYQSIDRSLQSIADKINSNDRHVDL